MRIYVCDYRLLLGAFNSRVTRERKLKNESAVRRDMMGREGGEKKEILARARTLVFPENLHCQPSPIPDRLHGEMRIFHVRGCIIEISALGRIKSGRRDQWLTRIVGAVRKIPYLHTKIRARPLAR